MGTLDTHICDIGDFEPKKPFKTSTFGQFWLNSATSHRKIKSGLDLLFNLAPYTPAGHQRPQIPLVDPFGLKIGQ